MEHQHKGRWAVTLMAVVLLLLTAANLFSLKEIFSLRQELNASTDSLSSSVSGLSDAVSGMQENVQNSIDKAKGELQSGLKREDSMLAEFACKMGKYNPIGETVKLTFQATPKEYREGVSVLFMYKCDDKDSVTVAGERDDNGVFQKEVEIALCDVMNIKVIVSEGGTIHTETVEEAFDVRKRVITPLGM